jgi:dual specificity tyrosine-phosphorylation-regulated kinase 2/3/4
MTTRDPFGQPDEIAHATPVVSERAARGCVRPDEALEAHARGELELSEFERGEIALFPEVWFTGLPGGAKPSPRRDASGEVSGEPSDFGPFADARLDYAGLACAGDHLAYRYEIERVIGKGSFAKVARCFDHKRNERVAVKVVRDAPRFHKQVEIEVAALRALGGAHGCVELLDVFAFRGHRCLVFELVSMSLRDWLTTHAPTPRVGVGPPRKTRVVGASVGMCRRVAGQLLDALAFLAEKSVIHRDVKLENVLLRSPDASEIVLVDFGSACFANEPRKHAMYVQSRHYRAPEVLLGAAYDAQIDVWSLGCVLAELHAGTPAFPGRDEADQLARIAEVIGPPPERVLRRGDEKKRRAWAEALERTRATEKRGATEAIVTGATIVGDDDRRRVGVPGSRSMRDALDGCDDGDFVDFVSKCLTWGADERLTPGRALLHPWTGGMGLLNFTRALRIEPPRANASVCASGGEKGDFVRRRNGTLSRPFSEPPPRDVGDPREAERRDAFFRSIPAVVQVEKKKVSLTSVMNAIAKDGQKTFRSRVRSAAAESTTRRARDEREKNAIRPNRSVRFADEEESFVGGIPGGLAGEVMHLPTEPSMLPPLPGMTEQIAARIAEIRELQASYAVPTGPPPPPPTESARRYSGVNPKMAEDEYYTERFHGRAAGRGREERAR